MKYRVMREHYGDRMYVTGDEREAVEADVKDLVARGILTPIEQKAEPAPSNKAETPPPNKADAAAASKSDPKAEKSKGE